MQFSPATDGGAHVQRSATEERRVGIVRQVTVDAKLTATRR